MILKTYMISERPYKNMDKPTEVLVMEEPPPSHSHTHTYTGPPKTTPFLPPPPIFRCTLMSLCLGIHLMNARRMES